MNGNHAWKIISTKEEKKKKEKDRELKDINKQEELIRKNDILNKSK